LEGARCLYRSARRRIKKREEGASGEGKAVKVTLNDHEQECRRTEKKVRLSERGTESTGEKHKGKQKRRKPEWRETKRDGRRLEFNLSDPMTWKERIEWEVRGVTQAGE